MLDALVIGAGLFGQLIARGLRDKGLDVHVIHAAKQYAGSTPAACIMNAKWSPLPQTEFALCLSWLAKRYDVKAEAFEYRYRGKATRSMHVFRVEPAEILQSAEYFPVRAIERCPFDSRAWQAVGQGVVGPTILAKAVIVAAGAWSQQLLFNRHDLGLSERRGVAWLSESTDGLSFIQPWAPFKQIVGFRRSDGYWLGDGLAKWHLTDSDLLFSQKRCLAAAGLYSAPDDLKQIVGIRPYTKEKPCLCKELEPGLWVATGGAKNGTILGARCAMQIAEAL